LFLAIPTSGGISLSPTEYEGHASEGITARKFISHRVRLVESVMTMVNRHGVVLIKAPPQVIMLSLLFMFHFHSEHCLKSFSYLSFQDWKNWPSPIAVQYCLVNE
jgi:hypothetical protein